MLRELGSVDSGGSKCRQAASTRQVTAQEQLRCADPIDRSAVPRARAPRLFPVQARAGTCASGADATSLFGTSSSVDRCEQHALDPGSWRCDPPPLPPTTNC